ncbi:MAG: glycosyl transferase [Caulobacteraceae bacterium]|nr:glycosyl transferase [Caulobacteraceae bacterium]
MTQSAKWAFIIAAWSGFHVMVVEMLSGRLIAPFFGSSVYVWGSVIFVFMFGLAIGYLVGGQLSSRGPSVRRLAGLLALGAAVTLPVIPLNTPLMNFVFDHVSDPRAGSLACCMLLFFLPAVAAGTISPYAVRIAVTDQSSSGRTAGVLYFVSTLGSSLGTLGTAFYFVLWAEVNTILAVSCGVSLALAALAFLMCKTPKEIVA